MGALAARFFTRLQAAGFYETLLRDALALLPDGDSRTLLDIGCGPGALTRLAAARGYYATGIDNDPSMIAQAKRTARREGSPAAFAVADLSEAATCFPPADVVAAASLLAVVPDPARKLPELWSCVAPDGALLIIEPSAQMNPANAQRLLASQEVGGRGRHLLTLWARARHGHTLNSALFDTLPEIARRNDYPLLGGLIVATLLKRIPEKGPPLP